MATDRASAARTTRVVALVAGIVLLFLLAVIVFRGCRQAGPGAEEAAPPSPPLPGEQTDLDLPPLEAVPLRLA